MPEDSISRIAGLMGIQIFSQKALGGITNERYRIGDVEIWQGSGSRSEQLSWPHSCSLNSLDYSLLGRLETGFDL